MERKLYRDESRKVVAGVCAGLADYFNIDVAIIRLVFVLALIFKGGGGLLYIILWIVLPKKPYGVYANPTVDYTVPPVTPTEPMPEYVAPQPRKSTGSFIVGVILILIGLCFLLDELNIIPDFDFDVWWPMILVVIGLLLIFGRRKPVTQNYTQQPWDKPEEKSTDINPPTDTNPPIV